MSGDHAPRGDEPVLDAALVLDVVAALLAAGQGLIAAMALAGEHVPGAQELRSVAGRLLLGATWAQAWAGTADGPDAGALGELRQELAFAHRTGAPTAGLLRATAAALRRRRRRQAEQAAERLAIRLVLPLGLCLLPAFICLGVIPLVIALLP